MKFDISKVYTCLNADKLEVGSQIVAADNLYDLKNYIETHDDFDTRIRLKKIMPDTYDKRFVMSMGRGDTPQNFALVYYIGKPQKFLHEDVNNYLDLEKKLSETYTKELNDKYKDDFDMKYWYQNEIKEWFKTYFWLSTQTWDSFELDFDLLQAEDFLGATWYHNDYDGVHLPFIKIEIPRRLVLTELTDEEIDHCIVEDDE